MKFGVQHPNFTYDGEGAQIPESLGSIVRSAERLGFDSFWVMDHLHQIPIVGKKEEPMLEGWTTISFLAGLTTRIKLGTLVTGNSYRYPALLAKIGATFDVLSKGRLFMGIGAAWNEEEALAYGIPFPPTRERLERLREAVQIIRAMWTEGSASFSGKYYTVKNAYCNPKPIQKPAPSILIGGVGEKMLLRIVAEYGDACNLFGSPETVRRKLEVLRGHCEDVGRDYDSILKTKLSRLIIAEDSNFVNQRLKGVSPEFVKEEIIHGTPGEVVEQIERFRSVGIQYLILSFNVGREIQAMTLFEEKVMPEFV